jgi:DNA gyrase/topoisomerase IV subunit B
MSVRESHIDITPDKSLYSKMAQTGYSFVQAISELIDNSIDSRIEGENLTVKIRLSKDSIEIMDDGEGMSDRYGDN